MTQGTAVTMSETDMERKLQELNSAKIEEYEPAIIYVAIVVLLGVVGNIMSVAFYGFNSPRTPTNIIITSLGIVDLLCCIVLSDEIIELCYTVTFKSVLGCKVMYFINHTFVFIAGNTLFFVAIDRFRKICSPFGWQFTIFRIKVAFVIIVSYSLATSVRDLVILDVVRVNVTHGVAEPVEAFYCTHSDKGKLQAVVTAFQIVDLLTMIVVVGGSSILYTFIAIKLWKSRNKVHVGDRKKEDISLETQNETTYTSASDSAETSTSDNTVNDKGATSNTDFGKDETHKSDVRVNAEKDSTTVENKNCKAIEAPEENKENNSSKDSTETETLPKDRRKSKKNGLEKRVNTIKKKVLKAANLTADMKVEQKVTLMMLVITSVSIISFVPYFVVNLGIRRNSETSDQEFSVGIQIALRSYILNNAVNPYIIGMFNSKFREFVKGTFCKRFVTKNV